MAAPDTVPSAPTTPSMSVLSVCQPSRCAPGVGRADAFGAFSALVGQSQRHELARHRHRQADHSGLVSHERRQTVGVALDALVVQAQAQRAVGGQMQLRRTGMGDRLADDGRAADSEGLSAHTVEHAVALGEFDVRQVLLVVVGEQRGAVHVDGDEVEPVAGLRMLGGVQRLLTRRTDQGGQQPVRRRCSTA